MHLINEALNAALGQPVHGRGACRLPGQATQQQVDLAIGELADRMARHPHQRWGNAAQSRRRLMRAGAGLTLAATLVIPFVAGTPWLAAPVAFVWGGAGGSLYTLVMIDIGSRETGNTLVNSTAVLVMSYTLGGVLAPVLGAAALQWSPVLGFPVLLLGVAALGVWLLRREPGAP